MIVSSITAAVTAEVSFWYVVRIVIAVRVVLPACVADSAPITAVMVGDALEG